MPSTPGVVSAEVQRTVAALDSVSGAARRPLENSLQDAGDQLDRCETRLASVERELADLDGLEIESSWVAECLTDFDQIWDVLTPENRGRLLRTVIQCIEVDEPANKVHVHIADLGADALVAPANAAAEELARWRSSWLEHSIESGEDTAKALPMNLHRYDFRFGGLRA